MRTSQLIPVAEKVKRPKAAMSSDPLVWKVERLQCKTRQKVHIAARPGLARTSDQVVRCIMCNGFIKVTVPDKIVGGPFPA
jgi:hypothetical protein